MKIIDLLFKKMAVKKETVKKVKESKRILLKDGREIFTTHNGFKYFVVSKKGVVEEVLVGYYNKVKLQRITKKSK